jgi:hypothetical protein
VGSHPRSWDIQIHAVTYHQGNNTRGSELATLLNTETDSAESVVLACLIVTIISAGFFFSSDQFNHWFLIPVAICGVLVGTDAIAWLRGRLGLYDPAGIIGLFGFHFFFLAPLLHVGWDLWIRDVNPPADWRDWLGYMATLNVIGLLCYRFCYRAFKARRPTEYERVYWGIDKGVFRIVAPFSLAVAAAVQIWVYARMGGISGFMEARQDRTAFEGMGWVFMISETVPILTTFLIIVYFQQRSMSSSKIVGALLGLFLVQMLFAGLRGSRSQTVEFLFWLVGCIHLSVRPVPRKLIYAGSVFLLLFLYIYGFYKSAGASGVSQALSGSEERNQLSEKSGRTFKTILLGDFGRTDVQAFILYKLINDGRDFGYAKGRTYLGAVSLLVPRFLLPDRPASKLREGTDIQAGAGTYVPGRQWSSRVYGLAGEAMLNFGPMSVPLVYALFGLMVGWVRTFTTRLLPGDSRLLLIPLLIYECFAVLIGDSDNFIVGVVKDGLLPFLVVALSSVRRRQFISYSFPVRTLAPATSGSTPNTGSSVRMSRLRRF